MKSQKRVPGAVDEKADPVAQSGINTATQSAVSELVRNPGPVKEPAEPVLEAELTEPPDAEVPRVFIESSPWNIVFVLLASAGAIWLLAEAVTSLIAVYNYSIYFGIPAIVFALLLLVTIAWAGHREYKALKSIDRLVERDEKIKIALETNDLNAFRNMLAPTLENIRKRHPDLIREYRAAIETSSSVADSLNQFENIVLGQLDSEVNALIKNTVIVSGAAVAVIPHPALDALFILWRGQNLIRKIGIVYGLEPTGLSSWRLLKHVITSAFIAATVEEFGEITFQQITQNTVAKALKPAAEGLTTALRLYRLGQLAKRSCRPKAAN